MAASIHSALTHIFHVGRQQMRLIRIVSKKSRHASLSLICPVKNKPLL